MPSGKPGKFSTKVVKESCPPGSWPSRTSGLRLARAVYRAAVCPEQPEPRMMTFRMFSLMDGGLKTQWLDEWQAGWFQPQPSYQDSSLVSKCGRNAAPWRGSSPHVSVTEETMRSSDYCRRKDLDDTCGSRARPTPARR